MKSNDFYSKRHTLARIHVVWAIFRECPLRGLTPRAEIEKSQKVTRGSHRNGVSPLTQGLNYRSACDAVTLKPVSGVIQGLWKWPHLIDRGLLLMFSGGGGHHCDSVSTTRQQTRLMMYTFTVNWTMCSQLQPT